MSRDQFIMVAFYTPAKDDPWLNHMVAAVDGPCCHVELAFPDKNYTINRSHAETATMQTVCIYQGGSVEISHKRFSRQNYSFQYIPVTADQLTRTMKMANTLKNSVVRFSKYSMVATFIRVLPLWYHQDTPKGTCCSILTTQLLQTAGVVDRSVNARRVTPSALQRILKDHANSQQFCFGATPFRLNKIRAVV
jgi:hypothetical protein